jgi:hypothetical protein
MLKCKNNVTSKILVCQCLIVAGYEGLAKKYGCKQCKQRNPQVHCCHVTAKFCAHIESLGALSMVASMFSAEIGNLLASETFSTDQGRC